MFTAIFNAPLGRAPRATTAAAAHVAALLAVLFAASPLAPTAPVAVAQPLDAAERVRSFSPQRAVIVVGGGEVAIIAPAGQCLAEASLQPTSLGVRFVSVDCAALETQDGDYAAAARLAPTHSFSLADAPVRRFRGRDAFEQFYAASADLARRSIGRPQSFGATTLEYVDAKHDRYATYSLIRTTPQPRNQGALSWSGLAVVRGREVSVKRLFAPGVPPDPDGGLAALQRYFQRLAAANSE